MKPEYSLSQIFLVLAILLLSATTSNAQVTIGTETKPNPGALLDLKQYEDATALGGGRTAEKGLLLPRVKLTTFNSLRDLNLSASDNATHLGLTIYNTNMCLEYGVNDSRGIYVWDGSKWSRLGKPYRASDVYEYVDNRDPANPQTYLYRKFGDAGTWMLENMRATKYEQGGEDVQLGLIAITGAPYDLKRYIYPGSSSGDGTNDNYFRLLPAMGLLYSWAAATNNENLPTQANLEQGQVAGSIPGPKEVESVAPNGRIQGICPNGWHLPSDREWNMLEKEISTYPEKYSTSTAAGSWSESWETGYNERGTHGGYLKTPCLPPGMGSDNAKGESLPAALGGFNLYLTGFGYSYGGKVSNYGSYSYFRTSSSSSDSGSNNDKSAWHRSLGDEMKGVNRINSFRNNLMSVRCVMD